MKHSAQSQQGFTLLEVVIALTITSMVLGGLFALAAGSKQLALRSQQTLQNTMEERAHIHFALLQDEYRGVEPILVGTRYQTQTIGLLPDSPRRTGPTNFLLQQVELINRDTGEVIDLTRWARFDLPQ